MTQPMTQQLTQRMNLLEIQREMAGAVMTPLTPDERMRNVAPGGRSLRAVANKIIKPNNRLTSFERLEIYNRQYWFRVLSGFAEDFPGLRAVLGTRAFDKLAQAYLQDCPSRSFTMRNIGSHLESWLTKHRKHAGLKFKLAVDMVRLEWADINAFDGTRETPLSPADLAQANPAKLRLRLQPYISLLDLRYPVDDLLLEVKKHSEELSVASNAFSERHKTKRVAAVARMMPSPIFLAVHRMGEEVYFRRLEREEFAILALLRDGKSLNAAIEAGLRNSATPADQRPLLIQKWFQTWSTLGWFCPWTKNSTRS
jgi:Putative DNA-binding domain